MDSIKVGIVGLGSFGLLHLDVLANMTGVEVVGLASRSQERARELADQYHVPHIFMDTAEMVQGAALDAAFIATEDTRHLEPTLTALRAGVDVFLEKPISHSLDEARQMIDEAARLHRKFMVGHVCRFEPRSAAIKQRITAGDLGQVYTVYGRRNMCKTFQEQYSYSNRLFTTGVHDIDLILWLYQGLKPVEVYMKTMHTQNQEDDIFWGMITMENGSLGIIETNWCLPQATPWRGHILLDVIGSKGAALGEIPGNGLAFWTDTAVEIPDTSYWPKLHGATVGALRDEFNYFIQCLIHDRPVTIPYPEDAYQSIRIAHALIESSKTGQPVRV